MSAPAKPRRLLHRLLQIFAGLAILGVTGVAALLASLRLEHRFSVTLPQPTGPFPVGRAVYDWVDDQGLDQLAPRPGTKRELLVWIWYPAEAEPSAAPDDYLPATSRTAVEGFRGSFITNFLTRDLSKVRAHCLRDPDVSPQHSPYPVLIMRGGASAEVWNYSTLAEDLASHGYVVVGFDAPYRTSEVAFPDGRILQRIPANNPEICLEKSGPERDGCANRILTAWAEDTAFVLDRLAQSNTPNPAGKFTNRLDMTRVGVFGHSFGGATAAQFCSQDSRCKAGVDVDGLLVGSVIQAGIPRPFMFLLSDHSHELDPEGAQIKADLRSVYDRLPSGRAFLMIRGAGHFLFSDDAALLKSHIVMGTLRRIGIVGLDGRRQLAVTAYCLRTFFDSYLKDPGATPPKIPSSLYPEIMEGLP